jgi:hypothetical protein
VIDEVAKDILKKTQKKTLLMIDDYDKILHLILSLNKVSNSITAACYLIANLLHISCKKEIEKSLIMGRFSTDVSQGIRVNQYGMSCTNRLKFFGITYNEFKTFCEYFDIEEKFRLTMESHYNGVFFCN